MTLRGLILIATLLALVACGGAPAPTTPASTPAAPTAAAPAAPATPAPKSVDVRQSASLAVREGRVIAPAGDNAFEWYLSLREQVPDDSSVTMALIDLMPIADQAARFALEGGDVAEATRIVDLMARYDADSETTKAARGRLADWQRERVRQEQALAARAEVAAQAAKASAAPTPATPAVAAPARAPEPQPPSPRPDRPTETPAAPALAAAPAPAAPTPAQPAAPSVQLTPPTVVRRAPAQYPPQAKRQGVEGFVELDLLVDAQGNPEDLRVVRSEPSGVFDKSAVRAVMRWKFEPARRNGTAEAARTRTVIQFRQG
jgi:protein TonB